LIDIPLIEQFAVAASTVNCSIGMMFAGVGARGRADGLVRVRTGD